MSRLALSLLGPPRLEVDGVPLEFNIRKNFALVAYLAVTGESHTREELVALLWPELEPSRARSGLRRNLSVLRKALGGQWLVVDRESVGLDPTADLWFDVEQYHTLLRAWQGHGHPQADVCPQCLGALAEAVELYRGDFLAGFTLRDSPGFDEWQFFETEGLRQELASALERLVRGHSVQGAYQPAIPYARRWVSLDSLHEPAHRHLMRLYVWSGQRAAAVRQYAECERVLQEELGVPPEEETTRLFQAIRKSRDLPSPGTRDAATGTTEAGLHERYQLGAELGRDGTGVAYRAHDTSLDRDVTVKVLSDPGLGEEGRAQVMDEACAAAGLSHPHIVTVYDVEEADGSLFVVMESVDGASLHEHRPQDLDEIISIACQVCAALAHAHSQGIVHRDLKPENVLLSPDPQTGTASIVKLTGFGLAQTTTSRLSQEGASARTVFYLAPELAMGSEFDGRADLYALGVMLYELTTGALPFRADDPVDVVYQHLHSPVVPPRVRNTNLPPALDALILGLLTKDPHHRPETAQQALAALEEIRSERSSVEPEFAGLSAEATMSVTGVSLLTRMRHGQLIGRERELAELRGSWERATQGEGHMVLISGEPGIGKSRLAEELKVHTRLRGGLVLEGRFYSKHEVAYLGFWEALRDYLRAIPPEVAREKIGTAAPELVKLVPEIQEIMGEIELNPPLGDAAAERLRLFDHTTQFLLGLSSESPILFVLDDLHWADEPSLFLLHSVLRNIQQSSMLLVGTYRETELDPKRPLYETLVGLNRERLYSRLILRRLSEEDVGELVSALLDGPVDEELVAEIVQETEGNPFFVEEVIKSLLEQESLGNEAGRWAPLPGLELEVPQSIRITIGRRLARLNKDGSLALTQAAILGRDFDFDLLLAMGEWDEDQLLVALEEIEQAQLATEIRGTTELRYRFGHALVVQVLYEGLNARRRARYHLRAGEAIERVYANRLGDQVEALAHHYSLAPTGAAGKAVDYSLLAAEKAVSVHAHEQAVDHYVNALEALEDLDEPVRKASVLELLGDTHLTTFFVAEAISAYEDALHVLEQAGATGEQAYYRLHAKLGRVMARQRMDPAQARAYLNSALERIPEDSPDRVKCLAALAQCMVQEQDLPQAHQQAEFALELARKREQPGAVASASEALSWVYLAQGDMEAFFSTTQRRIVASEVDDDLYGLFLAYRLNVVRNWFAGTYREGEQWALDGLRISAELNALGWEATLMAGYTSILTPEGRWSEVLACEQRLLPLFNRAGSRGCFCWMFLSLAEVESRLGNDEQARKHISDAEDIWFQLLGPENRRIFQWRFFGHLFLEEWELAWDQVERSRRKFGHETSVTDSSRFLWTIAVPQVAARMGRWSEAASLAEQVHELCQRPRLPLGLAMAHFALGLAHAGQRQWEQSLREYEAAHALFQELGHLWDVANAQTEMGLVLSARRQPGDLQAAKRLLLQALAGFECLAARPGMSRVNAALELIT